MMPTHKLDRSNRFESLCWGVHVLEPTYKLGCSDVQIVVESSDWVMVLRAKTQGSFGRSSIFESSDWADDFFGASTQVGSFGRS